MIFTGRKKYRPSQRGHWDQDRDMHKSCIFPFLAFLLKILPFFTSLFFLKYLSQWRQRSIVVKNAGKQAKEIYLSLTSDSSNSLAGVCVSVCVCSVVHGLQPARLLCLWIFPARTLKCVATSFSRGSSQTRDWTCVSCVSCIGRQFLYHCATREALTGYIIYIKSWESS